MSATGGGMLYRYQSFTVPASEKRDNAACLTLGFHVASGPERRRTCMHCGLVLPKGCPERVAMTLALQQGDLGEGTDEELRAIHDIIEGAIP